MKIKAPHEDVVGLGSAGPIDESIDLSNNDVSSAPHSGSTRLSIRPVDSARI